MKRINIGYFFKEGFLSVFSHGLMSFAAVCMIVCCLLIMGSFSLLAMNVDENLKKLEDDNEFLAYIDEAYTDAQIQDLIARVKAVDNVDGASVKTGRVSFANANDGTCEGLDYPGLRAFTVQFHPEARSGPQDTAFLFDRFVDLMKGGDL